MIDRDKINAENLFAKLRYSKVWTDNGFFYYNSINNKVVLFNLNWLSWKEYKGELSCI